jgi:hypothetical protein
MLPAGTDKFKMETVSLKSYFITIMVLSYLSDINSIQYISFPLSPLSHHFDLCWNYCYHPNYINCLCVFVLPVSSILFSFSNLCLFCNWPLGC